MSAELGPVDEMKRAAPDRSGEPDQLAERLAEMPADSLALAIRRAPGLERKTELLRALEDHERREVLERLPATLIAALVQNLEEDNCYLLGDLTAERFDELLSLCSPERRYYWLATAVSFTDARANVLPLLQDPRELAEVLLTRSEFEGHIRAVADHPIERERVPPDLLKDPLGALVDLIGPQHLLQRFPIREPRLAQLLQNILDFDPSYYVDLVREALALSDYAENNPEEWEQLTESPILTPLLDPFESLGERLTEADSVPEELDTVTSLIPLDGGALARIVSGLPAPERSAVAAAFQSLCLRQAIAEGGSMDLVDLRRIAAAQQAQLLLGLEVAGAGTPVHPGLLREYRLDRLARAGAAVLENLRQVALRLQPAEGVMSPEQRSVVRSLLRPVAGLDAAGQASVRMRGGGDDEWVSIPDAATRLRNVSAWITLVRLLGIARVEEALARPLTVPALQEELALSTLLYGAPALDQPEPEDFDRLAGLYRAAGGRELLPEAFARLHGTLRDWAAQRGGDPDLLEQVLDAALLRLAVRLR